MTDPLPNTQAAERRAARARLSVAQGGLFPPDTPPPPPYQPPPLSPRPNALNRDDQVDPRDQEQVQGGVEFRRRRPSSVAGPSMPRNSLSGRLETQRV